MWFHDTRNKKIMVKDFSEAMSSLRVLQGPREIYDESPSRVCLQFKIDSFLLINKINNCGEYGEE